VADDILGFEFYLGPKIEAPVHLDFTLSSEVIEISRKEWAKVLVEAIQYHDAWALLTTKPNGDVLLFDDSPASVFAATSWGGWIRLLLAREWRSADHHG
jgi:hypothetical protein